VDLTALAREIFELVGDDLLKTLKSIHKTELVIRQRVNYLSHS